VQAAALANDKASAASVAADLTDRPAAAKADAAAPRAQPRPYSRCGQLDDPTTRSTASAWVAAGRADRPCGGRYSSGRTPWADMAVWTLAVPALLGAAAIVVAAAHCAA
jgi:hypothetical protein